MKPAVIRIAGPADADAACGVLRRSILECCVEDHRHDEAVLRAWLENKTPENVACWFRSPSNHALVAIADGAIAGVAILTRAGRIALCYVAPEQRFTGFGTALLRALEVQGKQWGLSTLQVASTQTAKSFYLRHGYLFSGATRCSFGIDGLNFSKRLCTSYRQKVACGCTG
jgi:GNAT superfamily N-acetyltransferase